MISVVCWLWQGPLRTFLPQHANVLGSMIHRHLHQPHRFICVSDKADGLAPWVEWYKTPDAAVEIGKLVTPEGPRFPSCYPRLWSFSPEAIALGDRLLVVDIDLVVLKTIDHLFERQEEFVGWRPYRDWGLKLRYGGGIYLLNAGTRPHVWNDFKGVESIQHAKRLGYRGSDQAWISYCLCHNGEEVHWGKDAGLYSVRDMTRNAAGQLSEPPADACLIQFNGNQKPWQDTSQWVCEAWQ